MAVCGKYSWIKARAVPLSSSAVMIFSLHEVMEMEAARIATAAKNLYAVFIFFFLNSVNLFPTGVLSMRIPVKGDAFRKQGEEKGEEKSQDSHILFAVIVVYGYEDPLSGKKGRQLGRKGLAKGFFVLYGKVGYNVNRNKVLFFGIIESVYLHKFFVCR